MTEFAGVDPDRLRTLADRLKDLADTLARVGPTIRNNFSEWGGTLNLGPLHQQATQVGEDARKMALRADEALNLLRQPNGAAFCTPTGDWVDIPWDTKDINSVQEAQQEAASLRKALDSPKDAASRALINEIGQSLADHQGDSAYMTAFMRAGGIADATQVANSLVNKDGAKKGLPLSREAQGTLAQFGKATQAMSSLAVKGDYPKPAPNYLAPLIDPPDSAVWSTAMLFAYGPPGDTWDPTVLSDVGTRMLAWRAKQEAEPGGLRPGYTPQVSGSSWYGYGASPYSGPQPHAWYQDVGLNPSMNDSDHGQALTRAVMANDPSLAIMRALAQNAQASRDLLTKPEGVGLKNAQQLVNHTWQTPSPEGDMDESGPVGDILTFAATDRSPAHIDQSGQAADNILTAAAKEKDIFFTENKTERQQGYRQDYPDYPKATSMALASITGTWAQDLGSTIKTADSASHTHGYDPQSHRLGSNSADLENVMQLFVKGNPDAAAMFDTTLHEQVSEAAAGPDPDHDLLTIGNTAGLFTKAKVAVNYTQAQQIDEDHKRNLALLNTAGLLFGFVPGAPDDAPKVLAKGIKYSQNLTTIGRTIGAPTQDPFSTDNAASREALNKDEAHDQYKSFSPAVVQGLIRSGRMKPPAGDPSWYDPATKTVSTDANSVNGFNTWLGEQRLPDSYIGQFQSGFDTQEGDVSGS